MSTQWWTEFKTWLSRSWDRLLGREVPNGRGGAADAPLLPERVPLVDVFESESELLLRADVPGATPASTSISLEGDVVTIRANADHRCTWSRSFRVPPSVNPERIRARVRDGVLSLQIAKRPNEIRVIPVRTAEATAR